MTTKLEVYNLALLSIRESRLASLSEVRESRYNLDTVWDTTLEELISKGFWRFALRTVKIDSDDAITPNFGFRYCFNLPDDWVRSYEVSGSEFMDPPLEQWQEESNAIWAEIDPIYLRYVSNSSTGYGYDLARWPARFTRAMAAELAYRIAPKATGSSDSMLERLQVEAAGALTQAQQFDALREPSKRPPEGKWNQARQTRGMRRADWWRYA